MMIRAGSLCAGLQRSGRVGGRSREKGGIFAAVAAWTPEAGRVVLHLPPSPFGPSVYPQRLGPSWPVGRPHSAL